MKNFLKKLHIVSNQPEDAEGSTSSRGSKSSDGSLPDKLLQSRSHHGSEHKNFAGLSGWFSGAHRSSSPGAHRSSSPSPPSSSNVVRGGRTEPSDSASSGGLDVVLDGARRDSGSSNSRDPDIEEEYQIQLALELSAREDPEAVQIEAVKQISLGSCPPENSPAEVVAYRYWKYSALGYDDRILDGFYDVYEIISDSISERMPSLVDLQGTPLSDSLSWEAVLINRAADANLLKLEQKALVIASNVRSESHVLVSGNLVQRLAIFVAEYMGGPVGDPDSMSRAWRSLSYSLKAILGSLVLPLGSLTIGLARHRALLFKVLAESVGIPCRLVKGQQHTGFDGPAMNFVKVDDGREYIVDLMADPGTLIPSDAAGLQMDFEGSLLPPSPVSGDVGSSHMESLNSGFGRSSAEHSEFMLDKNPPVRNLPATHIGAGESTGCMNVSGAVIPKEEPKVVSEDYRSPCNAEKTVLLESPARSVQPHAHARSPSWTEGISSPAVRKMKVKDVSQYMIDAAKENPQLAQKLHDVLLESGVVAPLDLFTEIYSEQSDVPVNAQEQQEDRYGIERMKGQQSNLGQDDLRAASFLPPLPSFRVKPKVIPACLQPELPNVAEGLGITLPLELKEVSGEPIESKPEGSPAKYGQNIPVAAAAAAAAAVVASSMVVAAAKSSPDSNIQLPVAAAATATAAAVAATTAAVNKKYGQQDTGPQLAKGAALVFGHMKSIQNDGDVDGPGFDARGSGDAENETLGLHSEAERVSDKSTGNESSKSDVALDDVAECEIAWEDITLGERIGLGSYGEVYHGELHSTEVAVKKFLNQDITGESLEEFKSEVRIMKRLRHPNVVLFMGAVTRAPNLSIITEFLPRGSLYRLIHRPNNQLDERRRLRMALDTARGMNYLHNCSPVIVHRDLKSPNLLVDKNWVVKVCDFGLSRMKHSTFLSSRSTAGTAEWMAPEVLRNEPSDEKCDVYSFGVILWELCTLQQPWGGMNPMQVVGAVGFQHRRLDIPDGMDPAIADIIQKCWHTDPKMRPSFSEIIAALKPLQKPITSSHVHRSSASLNSVQRIQTAQTTEDPAD